MNGAASGESSRTEARRVYAATLRRTHLWVSCLLVGLAILVGVAAAWQLVIGVMAIARGGDVAGAIGVTVAGVVMAVVAGLLWATRAWVDAVTDGMVWLIRSDEAVGTAIPLDEDDAADEMEAAWDGDVNPGDDRG